MKDKEVTCKDCGGTFIVTGGEQEWYKEKGFTEPKRCPACRQARRGQVINKKED